MLQIIFFAIFLGVSSLLIPQDKLHKFSEMISILNDIIFKMVEYIIRFAPVGVFALMAGPTLHP